MLMATICGAAGSLNQSITSGSNAPNILTYV